MGDRRSAPEGGGEERGGEEGYERGEGFRGGRGVEGVGNRNGGS